MGLGTRMYKVDDITAKDLTLTFTTNAPTATTTLTVADGSTASPTEIHTALLALQTQVDALVVDMASVIAQLNADE